VSSWAQQWSRVERWYLRFSETNSGRRHDRESDYYQDEAYAFFQNAYHLKDWLKNDPNSSAIVSDIEQVISQSRNLSLCADLCNGSKHLRLDRPRASADTKIGQRHFSVGLSEPQTISARYVVESAGASYDAFAVAGGCMQEWRAYLSAKGLL
jgi:hypothetical protein